MGTKKLRPWVIPTLIVIVIALIGGIAFGVVNYINNKNDSNPSENTTTQTVDKNDDNSPNSNTLNRETIKGYVNTFSGYTSLFAANGGNVTKDDSNFNKAGLNVEISIEDDDDNIIKAFENGDIQFFAMTVNKMAMVSKQLEDKGIETIMPYFLDTSTGGDGIVTDN